jgi:hypothetical protein
MAEVAQIDLIRMRIADLTEALNTSNPGMFSYLKDIHVSLMRSPELVHMLTNEERSQVIRGLEVKTGESITTPKAKSAALPKRGAMGGSVADLL